MRVSRRQDLGPVVAGGAVLLVEEMKTLTASESVLCVPLYASRTAKHTMKVVAASQSTLALTALLLASTAAVSAQSTVEGSIAAGPQGQGDCTASGVRPFSLVRTRIADSDEVRALAVRRLPLLERRLLHLERRLVLLLLRWRHGYGRHDVLERRWAERGRVPRRDAARGALRLLERRVLRGGRRRVALRGWLFVSC